MITTACTSSKLYHWQPSEDPQHNLFHSRYLDSMPQGISTSDKGHDGIGGRIEPKFKKERGKELYNITSYP